MHCKPLFQQLCKFIGAILLNNFFDCLVNMSVSFKIEKTCPVTLAARVLICIDLGSFALEAGNFLLTGLFIIAAVAGDKQVALDFLSVHVNHNHLVASINCSYYRFAITPGIDHFHADLNLCDFCFSACRHAPICRVYAPCTDPNMTDRNKVSHVSLHIEVFHNDLITSDSF